MHPDLVPRIGSFLILGGIGVLMVFITYEVGGTAHYDIFFISLIIIYFGIRLRMRKRTDSPSTRLKSVRKLREKIKQKKDQKKISSK